MPTPETPPAVLHVAASAAPAAERLGDLLGVAPLRPADGEVGATLRALFLAGRPILGVMAAGILIRALAPVLRQKGEEPPVLAVAEDLSSAIPLLGGHRGANALARRVAEATGAHPALTTAGEIALGVALDAPPPGWRLSTPEAAKRAMAGLLAGRPATLSGEAAWLAPLTRREGVRAEPGEGHAVTLRVAGAPPLRYHRPRLALGVGAARGASPEEVCALAEAALAEAGAEPEAVALVASLDLKADEAAVHALARHLGVPARFFDAARLEIETPRLATPSEVVFREVGCHGVAEAAALAAAGAGGRLVVAKRKSAEATVALAERAEAGPLPGRPRGRLAIVGLGPGVQDWRTPEASRLISEAEELVGYGLYLDLAGPLAAGKARTEFPLGAEEARCRHALERAGEGASVALLSSGDAGIYAMASLVFELLDPGGAALPVSPAARRSEIVVAPGISALQAAAARAGALLGHDFCAVSLSDLLTPRETILARLDAAALGDFVVALYNPVSARRRTLLDEAKARLLAHRPPETPVLIARNLGREGERCRHLPLAELTVEAVDMLSVVLVGASGSRTVESGDRAAGAGGRWLYTPRGYGRAGPPESAEAPGP